MALRHPRTAGDAPPEVLRLDLRITSAHPLARIWAFKRPYLSGQAIKAALERVIQLQGEEGLDRLLSELAMDGGEGGGTEREAQRIEPAPKIAPRPAPNIEARAPNIEPPAPHISEPAPHISASVPAKAPAEAPPAAEPSPEPSPEPKGPKEPVPVSSEGSQAAVAISPEPALQPQINEVSAPAEAIRGAEADPVGRAEAQPQPEPQPQPQPQPQAQAQAQESGAGAQVGTSPVEALASIGADTLRKKQNSLAALLQNEKLFNGGPPAGRNLV